MASAFWDLYVRGSVSFFFHVFVLLLLVLLVLLLWLHLDRQDRGTLLYTHDSNTAHTLT